MTEPVPKGRKNALENNIELLFKVSKILELAYASPADQYKWGGIYTGCWYDDHLRGYITPCWETALTELSEGFVSFELRKENKCLQYIDVPVTKYRVFCTQVYEYLRQIPDLVIEIQTGIKMDQYVYDPKKLKIGCWDERGYNEGWGDNPWTYCPNHPITLTLKIPQMTSSGLNPLYASAIELLS